MKTNLMSKMITLVILSGTLLFASNSQAGSLHHKTGIFYSPGKIAVGFHHGGVHRSYKPHFSKHSYRHYKRPRYNNYYKRPHRGYNNYRRGYSRNYCPTRY